MADDSAERTEEPTSRRLSKAREEGKVPRSMELPSTVVMLIAMVMLTLTGTWLASGMASLFKASFVLDRKLIDSPAQMPLAFASRLADGFTLVLPIMVVTAAVALMASVANGGFLFSVQAVQPKLEKLSPLSGLKRMFGSRSLIELGKTLLKFTLVITVLVLVLESHSSDLLRIGAMSLEPALEASSKIVLKSALYVTLSLLVIALIDVPLQRFQFRKSMRMTKQEIKDEMKEAEGRPEVKAKIRQRQREMANAKMMKRVKEADVVITNPEHFAVALLYDPTSDAPPILVAKGADFMAQNIREEASKHGVQVFEAPPLARALFFTTELEHPVPEELYFAVAQVIAYVFSLAEIRPGAPKALKPVPSVPASMRFDSQGQILEPQGVRV